MSLSTKQYYFRPPTILYHPPEQGETRITYEESEKISTLTHLSELPSTQLFAVVLISGKQHKVTVNDIILVNEIPILELYTQIKLNKILLVGGVNATVVGQPLLRHHLVNVYATLLEHRLTDPLIVFKIKRKKNYKKTKIHRQPVSLLQIEDIIVNCDYNSLFELTEQNSSVI